MKYFSKGAAAAGYNNDSCRSNDRLADNRGLEAIHKAVRYYITNLPHIGQRLLEMALDELDAAREWMLLLGRKTAREKIASLIAIIARRDNSLQPLERSQKKTVDLPLTREAMADYLGLTLETVSRQISALKKDGLITLEGKRRVIIPDIGALIAETGDDTDGGPLVWPRP